MTQAAVGAPISSDLAARMRLVYTSALKLVERLPDVTVRRSHGPHAPAIAFHLWHMSRWSDRTQSVLPTMSARLAGVVGRPGEIWAAEGVAATWGLAGELGNRESGADLRDDIATALTFPPAPVLLDYVRRAFAAAGRVYDALRDEDLALRAPGLYGEEMSVMEALLAHQGHMQRHLGMIEALVGIGGERGTATR